VLKLQGNPILLRDFDSRDREPFLSLEGDEAMFTLGLSGTGGCGIGISTGIDQQVNDVRPVGEVTGPIRDEMECGAATTSGYEPRPCEIRAAR